MILAHATGGAVDLLVPVWLAAYGAGAVLVIGFLALRVLWLRPRLAAASLGQDLGPPVQWARRPLIAALRAVGLVLFVAELYAAGWGIDRSAVERRARGVLCDVLARPAGGFGALR